MDCINCIAFEPIESESGEINRGTCHRYAPKATIAPLDHIDFGVIFPPIDLPNWCVEHIERIDGS
jgi:hypothetical protein